MAQLSRKWAQAPAFSGLASYAKCPCGRRAVLSFALICGGQCTTMLTWRLLMGRNANDCEEIHKVRRENVFFCLTLRALVLLAVLSLSGSSPPPKSRCLAVHHLCPLYSEGFCYVLVSELIEGLGLTIRARCSSISSWALHWTSGTLRV